MDQPSSADDSGITLRIKFKSESVDAFIARYGADVSPGGIFIRTRDPLGVGTSLRFEFNLAGGQPLLAGHGTVVWVREPDQTRAGVIPGMGVRFDKLSPESQTALGTILAGKTGKESSGAARLSASRPIAAASPLEPEQPADSLRPTPASMKAVSEDGAGTADPWQSDKTEIAKSPPNFGADGARTSEELSLSGAEPVDFGAARGPAPGSTPVLPRRPPVVEPPKAPQPSLGSVIRDAAGNVSTPVRRNSPAVGVGATPILPASPAPGPAPGPTTPRSLSPAQGVPATPPSLGQVVSRPSGSMMTPAALGTPGEDGSTDPFNRESAAAAGVAPVQPGRGKMLVVIALSALATAAIAFVGLKKWAVQETPPPAQPQPPIVTNPVPPAPTPAPPPAPPPSAAPTPPPAAAAPTPPAAAPAPEKAAATPPPAETPPPPKAAAAPTKAPKPAKPKKTTKTEGGAGTEPAEATATDEGSGAVEEYWLRVRSTPAGAEVLIDGQVEGKTPFERRLFDPTRPYALTVRKPGYETHEQMLSASDEWVKKGSKRTLTVPVKLTKSKGGGESEEKSGEKLSELAPVENPPANP